jgi:hypothetical protein
LEVRTLTQKDMGKAKPLSKQVMMDGTKLSNEDDLDGA